MLPFFRGSAFSSLLGGQSFCLPATNIRSFPSDCHRSRFTEKLERDDSFVRTTISDEKYTRSSTASIDKILDIEVDSISRNLPVVPQHFPPPRPDLRFIVFLIHLRMHLASSQTGFAYIGNAREGERTKEAENGAMNHAYIPRTRVQPRVRVCTCGTLALRSRVRSTMTGND